MPVRHRVIQSLYIGRWLRYNISGELYVILSIGIIFV